VAEASKIRNIVARHVIKDLKQAGFSPDSLLREAGLQIYQINRDDGWLPYSAHAQFLEIAARELDDPYYGLNLARKFDPRDLGALAYVGLSSRTLQDALLNLERYMTVQTEAWSFDLVLEARSASLQLTPSEESFYDFQQASEAFAGGIIYGYQFFLSQPLAPIVVRFVHSLKSSKDQARYEELLGCPVEFNRNQSQIVLDRKSLALSISTADDRLLQILKSYCEEVLQQHKPIPTDVIGRVRQTIVDLLPSGRAKAETVANELGMTKRTMHRRLADAGTSFTQIHNRLRRDLAEKYVKDETLNLQKIAFLLGYADQSAFSVAFRRWTGHSPKKIRAKST
jgi:AraC-like DNA-binding protein